MAAAKAAYSPLRSQLGSAFCARLKKREAPCLKGNSCHVGSCRSINFGVLSSTVRGWQLSHAGHDFPHASELCIGDSGLRTRRQSFSSKGLTGGRQHLKQGHRNLPLARGMAAGGDTPRDGKVIVVTGVSKGLGQSLAVELASRGHTVVGCARSEAAVNELAERLGDPHSFSAVDVASDKEVKSWADATIKRFGVPDILVNNAGLINKNAPLWEVPVEEFDAVIDVNIKGTANVIRHFVPHMVAKQKGTIVNMSSGWGRSAAPDVAPYCTTKWGVEGMSRSLARELPRGCIAVALNPGVINTDMLQSCFGPSASMYQTPDTWSRDAADLILSINVNDNGSSMTVT